MDEFQCQLVADFLMALSSPVRLRMFCAMKSGPKTVTELAEAAGVTLQNASQHLRIMRDKSAVRPNREGTQVYYELIDSRFVEAAGLIRDALVDSMQQKIRSADGRSAERVNE